MTEMPEEADKRWWFEPDSIEMLGAVKDVNFSFPDDEKHEGTARHDSIDAGLKRGPNVPKVLNTKE